MVKRLPKMQETWVQSLGQEDALEKEMATLPRIHAWKILWTKEPDGLQSMGSQRVTDMTEPLHFTSLHYSEVVVKVWNARPPYLPPEKPVYRLRNNN